MPSLDDTGLAEGQQLRLFDLGPDVEALRAVASTLVRGSRASNTERAYAMDWRDFSEFCATIGRSPLPASEETLCMYVADGLKRLKVSTIQRRLCAVLDAHKRAGLPWPGAVMLRDVLRGARRARGTAPTGKSALHPEELRDMCRELMRLKSFTGVRDRALLTLGFASGMRRSELVALELRDVQFVRKGLLVTIRRSKTDQEGQGRQIGVFHGRRVITCPVRALKAWLYVRGKEPGPIFPGRGGAVMEGRNVGLIVKNAVALIGLDATKYGPHSLRAGFVTTAAEAGMPETLIMQRTGHKSVQTVARYVRPARLFQTDALARAL
jgi:integrase